MKNGIFSVYILTSLFALTSVVGVHAQNRENLGPALVAPPDILTEEADPTLETFDSVEAPDTTKNNSRARPLPDDRADLPELNESTDLPELNEPEEAAVDSALESPEEEAVKMTGETDLPQIYRKKESADSYYRPESRYIEHPNAARGLIKIDKEKNYIYKVEGSEQKNAGSVRLGAYEPTELVNPENSDLSFDNMYSDESFPILLYDQEWQFSQSFGKLAWKLGGGLYMAQGQGQFENTNPDPTAVPEEKFTLFVIPLNAGVTYRFHYWRNQWFVPYVEGGIDAMFFGEVRDDDQNPDIGAALGLAPAAHFSAGGSISLGRDARSFLDLDREYGINAVYFTVEYRRYIALSDKYDFSGDAITGGITAEY